MDALSDETFRTVVAQAVVANLGTDHVKTLLTDAVTKLLTPEKSKYGEKTSSPLQSAFECEVRKIAENEVARFLAEPAQSDAIGAVIRSEWGKFMANETRLSAAFQDAFSRLFDAKDR